MAKRTKSTRVNSFILTLLIMGLLMGQQSMGKEVGRAGRAGTKGAPPSSESQTARGTETEQGTELALRWTSTQDIDHWLFETGAVYRGPTRLAPLAQIKKFEYDENYEKCTEQILAAWSQYKDYRGWMALQGTHCLVNQLKFAGPLQNNLYAQWWRHLFNQGDWIFFGPWTAGLVEEWGEFAQLILKSKTLPIIFRGEVAETWRRYLAEMNQGQRKEVYQVIVEQLQRSGQKDLSEAIALREDLKKGPMKELIPSGEPELGAPFPKGMIDKKNLPTTLQNQKEEDRLNEEFQTLMRQKKWASAVQVGVKSLDLFPTGRHSSAMMDKIQQTYFRLFGNGVSEKEQTLLNEFLEPAQSLHASLQTQWARAAHRRGDFMGALRLAKWALLSDEKSPAGADLLFIAGRSAYFSGRYQEAIEYFNRIMAKHFAYPELQEIRFRRSLALIRIGEDQKAEEALTEMAADNSNKSYGVSSLYWLIRLKQKRKAEVGPLLSLMQEKYALTYFGLRLNAEMNGQRVVFKSGEPNKVILKNWVLTPSEKKQWERVQDLVLAGWYEAAQGEMNNLVLGGSPEHRFLWVTQMAKVFAFPEAIKQLNQLIEEDTRWRDLSFLRSVFPKPLKGIITREAQTNNLDPDLVFSLIRQESAFSLKAASRVQAMGLMQMIPQTANEIAQELKLKKFHSDQMFHPAVNLKFGAYYLAKVIRQFGGNVSVGLAAYNAGPQRLKIFFAARPELGNIQTLSQEDPWSELWIEELPWLETNLYVKSILRNRVIYQVLEQGTFVWPTPVWKDLYKGVQTPSQKDSV